jgi:EAL domain-containing protein (putative c-di-GMP-specific phosphodiesterase class I)
LAYLKKLPVDVIKVDRSFVMGLPESRDDAAIAKSVIALGLSLGREMIAEGVETPEQLQLLAELGCDQYQGFYFSPALLPLQFAALVNSEPSATDDEAERTHSKLAGLTG